MNVAYDGSAPLPEAFVPALKQLHANAAQTPPFYLHTISPPPTTPWMAPLRGSTTSKTGSP